MHNYRKPLQKQQLIMNNYNKAKFHLKCKKQRKALQKNFNLNRV